MADWGFEPGILFKCPECGEAEFITTATLRDVWEDDEDMARTQIGVEPWVNLDDMALDKLSLIPEWVCCQHCRAHVTLIQFGEDEEVEESGYGGTGIVIS